MVFGLLILISKPADAQFLNKLQKHAENKVEREAEKRANRKVDKQINKGFDAAEAANQKLSEARAKAVMDQLITMGISANRLKSGGWGESKPVDANASSEGKANNRRVEFVKF